ncbi:xylulokinase [Microbacterium wangchenii]|uniref:xylulokinase n=1 Tax=Microbacterium wangchenii TaxID=2541726 RepID=UPI0011C85303|nr:FGGY family carbohydrate kinase [Microbacterium wangchenii]TXK14575.1 hypothetical protein FVP99_12775 [Microbacterium wangchenii]
MTLIAGLDIGTSSVKLAVLTSEGTVIARATASYDTVHGPGGIVEQRPEDWWDAACRALADTGVADRIDALGVTGQMQDLIVVGAGGRSLRPALLYSDTRAGAQHERLRASIPEWERRTGNHQDLTNVAAKLAWLAEHEPRVLAEATQLFFGAAGYLAWRAGGRAICDVTTASTTGLLDIDARTWLVDAISAAGAPADRFPVLVGAVPGDASAGTVSPTAAAELGVRAGIPVVAAPGDAGSATDGLVGSAPGDAYLYLGTTGWLAGVTAGAPAEPSPIHSLVLPGWNHRLRVGAVQSAGSAAAWARRTFFPRSDFAEVEAAVADRVGDLSARPLCLPGLAGERTPVRDGHFRGAFVGVTDATDAADHYLAVLTGVAMGLRHAAEAMQIRQTRIPAVGGAASSPAWRQILADVFDATIVTGDAEDPGCVSAARAAADAAGLGGGIRPLLGPGAEAEETHPGPARSAYARLLATHRELYPALTGTFHALAGMPPQAPYDE